jgi:hypothetical protein
MRWGTDAGRGGELPRRAEPEEGYTSSMVGPDAAASGWDLGGDSVQGDEDQDPGGARLVLSFLSHFPMFSGGAELCCGGMFFISMLCCSHLLCSIIYLPSGSMLMGSSYAALVVSFFACSI